MQWVHKPGTFGPIASAVSTFTALLLAAGCGAAAAAPLTAGNYVVYRVGNGSVAPSDAATPVFLDEFRADGTLVQSIPMPTAASGAHQPLTASKTGSEGLLNRSANGQCLAVPGYAAAPGTSGVKSATAAAAQRLVGLVDAAGAIDTRTALGTSAFSTDAIRAATSNDCSQVWASGNGTSATRGVWHAPAGSAATQLNNANFQGLAIAGGQLYGGSGSLNKVGTGLPTSTGQTLAAVASIASDNYRGIAFAQLDAASSGPDTLYLAANGTAKALLKYALNTSTQQWEARGSVALPDIHGLVATPIGDGMVMLLITDGTKLYQLFDRAGRTGTLAGTPAVLALPTGNSAFYGVAPTPEASLATQAPGSPGTAQASSVTSSGFTASWTAPASGGSTSFYVVELSRDGFTTIDRTVLVHVADGTSVHFTGLANGSYSFRVRAVNSAGGSTSLAYGGTVTINNSNTPPSITGLAQDSAFSGVQGDPLDPLATSGIRFSVADAQDAADSLALSVVSSNPAVVPPAQVSLLNQNGQVTVKVSPAGVGYANLTLTVTDSGGLSSSRTLRYAASAHTAGTAGTRWFTGRSDASTALVLADGQTMLVGDDEAPAQDASGNPVAGGNGFMAYDRRASGAPVAALPPDAALGLGRSANCSLPGLTGLVSCKADGEVDIEASAQVGNRIYVTGSHSNSKSGNARADRWRFYATDVSGTGAATTASPLGYYQWLREDLRAWDANNIHGLGAHHLGLVASSAGSLAPESSQRNGFSFEGITTSPGDTAAWFALRAPMVSAPGQPAVSAGSATGRTHALIVQVENFDALATASQGGAAGQAMLGSPIRLDLGGRAIREIRKNAAQQYLIVAGPPDSANGTAPRDFRLYTWDGSVDASGLATHLRPRSADLASITAPHTQCSAEGLGVVPADLDTGGSVDIISDCGDADFYNDGKAAKELAYNSWKKFRADLLPLAPLPTATLALGTTTGSSQTVQVSASQTGQWHWVLLPAGAAAPDFTQVLAGQDAAGQAAPRSGQLAVAAATATPLQLDSLSPVTGYTLWGVVLAQDVPGTVAGTGFGTVQLAQAIDFPVLPGRTLGAGSVSLSASGGDSGNPVDFASQTPSVCLTTGAHGATLVLATTGTCTVRASQAGNTTYAAATPVDRSFTISLPPGTGASLGSGAGNPDGLATLPAGGGWVFAPAGSGPLQSSGFIPLQGHAQSPADAPPTGVQFPHGLLHFVLLNGTPGSVAAVQLSYPAPLPAGARYYKYGPVVAGGAPQWYSLPEGTGAGMVEFAADRRSLTLRIADGGRGDNDLAADGTIVDPGGVGVQAVAQAVPVPTLSQWGLALLALALGGVGWVFARKNI